MTKRLAAAVLCTIVNLLGNPEAGSGASVDEDDDAAGIAFVELQHDQPMPGPSNVGATANNPLVSASHVIGDDIEHAWLVHHHSGLSAAVTVQHDAYHDHAAIISLSADLEILPWEPLLSRSLAFCRGQDVLKVTLQSEGVSSESVRSVADASGFSFSRLRHADGIDVSEFYTDLYRRPGLPGAASDSMREGSSRPSMPTTEQNSS